MSTTPQREIKFRAWLELEGKMAMTHDLAFEQYAPINELLASVEHLMQFTGLLDKNGKEIYEGDIVQYDIWHKETVVFWEGCFVHMRDDGNGHIFNPKSVEVIGNIYENPDLLAPTLQVEQEHES